jgi:galactose-1-phosphate uridylyltransferase
VFDRPDYNVVIFTAPLRSERLGFFSWHARIQPRITVRGGFELATGTAITVIAPEEVADLLRAGAE